MRKFSKRTMILAFSALPMGAPAFAQAITPAPAPQPGQSQQPGDASTAPGAPSATSAAAQAPTSAGTSGQLQDIVVTARRREESLQKVPVSVTAVGAAAITEKSANGIADLSRSIPNISFNTQAQGGGSTNIVFMRGIGQSDGLLTQDPGVGVYLDGIYFGRSQGLDVNVLDVQRVEVLRGPQGTLFGKNTIGGAINIVSKAPDVSASAPTGRIAFIGGDYSRHDGIVNLNIPVVQDKLAISFSGSTRNRDGYGRSTVTGDDLGNVNALAGRLVVLYKPSSAFDATLSVDASRENDRGPFFKTIALDPDAPLVQLYNSVAPTPIGDNRLTDSFYTNQQPIDGKTYNMTYGTALTLVGHLGNVDLKSISSYRHMHVINDESGDATNPSILILDEGLTQHQVSQEFQASGKAFDDRLNYTAGLYYFNEKATDLSDFNIYPELYDYAGVNLDQIKTLHIDNTSYAAYGQGTYKLTEKLHFTAGLRYNIDKKSAWVTYILGHDSGPAGVIIPFTTRSLETHSLTPRFSLDYQWTPTFMTYVSAASGYKTGGFNGRASSAAEFNTFRPEKVWTYEAGFRSDLFDHHVRLNVTGYYSDYKDIQVSINGATTSGQEATIVTNAASARIQGGEVELIVMPVRGLRLEANGGLTDAKYKHLDPGVPFTTSDHFTNTPKWTYSLGAEYAMRVNENATLTPRLDWNYRSTTYYEPVNVPLSTQKGYGLFNARLTYALNHPNVSFAIFGTNLTDRHYATGAGNFYGTLGFSTIIPGAPREFGGQVEFKF